MGAYLIVIGFILFFFYDINQIKFKRQWLSSFFIVGVMLILFGTVMEIINGTIVNYWGLLICAIGFVTTIYVLFFALNFDNTYVDEHYELCDTGVYGLCRHPGFYTLFITYLGLAIAFQTKVFLIMLLMVTIMNFLYILFQDVYVFEIMFKNYSDYKKRVPFLIFNAKSIKRCITTFRGNK